MYVDTITKKVGNTVYTRYLIRDSHWKNEKVRHRTIAHISRCSLEEIRAIRLALRYKGNIAEVLPDMDQIQTTHGLSVGAVKYNQIPEPRSMGSKLLTALSITLPKAIPSGGICVSTRKKLNLKRKK